LQNSYQPTNLWNLLQSFKKMKPYVLAPLVKGINSTHHW
jgi:hypothetical protein